MSESQRFRRSFNQGGFVYFDDGQQRSLIQGRINLDPEARYTIGFRASSGHFFNWAYADYAGEGFSERVKDTALLLPSYNAAELQERTLAIEFAFVTRSICSSIRSASRTRFLEVMAPPICWIVGRT